MSNEFLSEYRKIGQRVKFYRELRRMSQEELSEKIGRSRSTIAKLEAPNAETKFSLDILFAIAKTLEIRYQAFFNDIELEIITPYDLKKKD